MRKNIFLSVGVVVIFIGVAVFLNMRVLTNKDVPVVADNKENVPQISEEKKPSSIENFIRVSFPAPNEKVGGKINVTGIARGTWYFEGEFPVELQDTSGKIIAWAPAHAQGGWMKEDFIPFVAVLEYRVTKATEAKIVLRRNNPSDLREQDMALEIPVVLEPKITSTQVFFSSNYFDRNMPICNQVFPVGRAAFENMAYAHQTVEMLLEGPTDREKELGYDNAIPLGVKIQSFDATMPTAKIDLSRELLNLEVNTACPKIIIQAQLEKTVKTVSDAKELIITVDGKSFPGEFPNEGPGSIR